VKIAGFDYVVVNGAERCCDGTTKWTMRSKRGTTRVKCRQKEVKRKPFAWCGKIKHTYKFFMEYWYDIDKKYGNAKESKVAHY